MLNDIKVFGFWIYLMTDLVVFAVLFATFVVLRNNTFGGPSGHDLFSLPQVFAETMLLLTSSFTCSLVTLAAHREQRGRMMFWLFVTFLLGAGFLILELQEFSHLIAQGDSWKRSGFLSAFFTLVGTHGLHISIGMLWMIVAIFRLWLRPLSPACLSQVLRFAFFWHFLDFVWVFIFSVVYGMGILS